MTQTPPKRTVPKRGIPRKEPSPKEEFPKEEVFFTLNANILNNERNEKWE